MAESKRLLILSSPPFVSEGETIERVMWRVNLVLLPALAWGVWSFGLDALRVAASCVASCVLAEAAAQRIMQRPVTVSDGSAVVTGILLAFNLPPGIPTWMTVVGSVAAIAIAKQAFGGLGFNIFNPALIGRAFLLASYPVPMTSWRPYGACDGVTCATPLGIIKEKLALPLPSYADMFLGRTGGCIGETSTLLLLAGALYLLWRRDITWHAPASFLGCLAIASRLSGRDPAFAVLAGGAVLGDRVRMMRHAGDRAVFIRSLSTRGQLGGVSAGVPGALATLALFGCDLVIIETVGVGQCEIDVARLADRGADLLVDVLDALRRLSVRQRAVIYLTYWLGMRADEVARTLDVSLRTVERELTSARGRLEVLLR